MKGSFRRTGREVLGVFTAALREVVSPSHPPPIGTTRSNNCPFQYTPLASTTSFRILHLKRVIRFVGEDKDMPLCGSLIEASIDAPPEYYALSYTWGDPTLCASVEIDGKTLGITANCASALRRMLRGKAERYIWVDSICINQADTPDALEERGGQVAMMDRIYRSAIQVNVHLGEGDPAAEVAVMALKSLGTYCTGAMLPGPQQSFFRRKYESLADDVLTITPEYPYGKLHGMFRLPWFRRTWVVQEVVLGRNVLFYCGKHLVHWKLVVAGADFGGLPYSKIDLDVSYRHWKSYLDYHNAMNEFIRRKEEGESISNFRLTLSGVLVPPALMLEATRPEDKIYAFYGMCKRFGFELPAPDYQKPLAAIYTEAARAIIRYEPGLELLSYVCESSGWERGLPSWVPNFSGCIRRWSPSNPPHMAVFGKGNPDLSGHTRWEYGLTLDGQALNVKGRRLDVISASGLPWMTDASTNMLGDARMQTGQSITSLIDCIGSWFDVVRGRSDYQEAEAAAWQLIAQLLTQHASQSKPLPAGQLDSFVRCVSVLVARSRSYPGSDQVVLMDPQENLQDDSRIMRTGEHVLSPGMNAFLGTVTVNHWKAVFRTVGGYIGLGTHTVQEGDIVAVFNGSSLAAILRPWGDWFRYVGPAYVGGIMDGEFWNARSPEHDEWYVLI